jgi:DNA-binding LytR/AlgR family response regulator
VAHVKVLILDSNDGDVALLTSCLENIGGYEVAGVASTMKEGMELAWRERPDLIFTDVTVGSEASFRRLGELVFSPFIICITSDDRCALEAYELGVIDYLIKPVSMARLGQALSRLPARISPVKVSDGSIMLRTGDTTRILPLDEILLIAADRDYTIVHDGVKNESLSNRRMQDWIELLPSDQFISLDRSTIINWKKVFSFTKTGTKGKVKLMFENGHVYEIGTTAYNRLRQFFSEV